MPNDLTIKMIPFLVLLVVIASAEAKLELAFTQSSQELDIRCSLPDIGNTSIVKVISLQMSRDLGGRQIMLATVTPFGEPVTNVSKEVTMTSSVGLDGTPDLFLNLHWPIATTALDGSYKCELRGLDDHNTPVTLDERLRVTLQDLQPVLIIKPSLIEVGLTASLEVTCSLTDLFAAEISSMISIELFRIQKSVDQHLAIASVFYGVEPVSGVSNAVVTGFIGSSNKVNYLKITWPHPSFDHIGDYICQVAGLNTSGQPINLHRIITLTAVDPPRQLLIDRILHLEALNQSAWEEISQLKIHKEELVSNFSQENKDLIGKVEAARLKLKRVRTECPNLYLYKNVCDFQNDMCGFVLGSSKSFIWSKISGSTSSFETGPPTDHTLGNSNGYYVYTESSSGQPGDKAKLSRPLPANPQTHLCINFWYSMYGKDMGALNVYIKSGGDIGSPVWSKKGNQGGAWKEEFITVPPSNESLTLVFEGVKGESYTSDIAIDDITVYDRSCQ